MRTGRAVRPEPSRREADLVSSRRRFLGEPVRNAVDAGQDALGESRLESQNPGVCQRRRRFPACLHLPRLRTKITYMTANNRAWATSDDGTALADEITSRWLAQSCNT